MKVGCDSELQAGVQEPIQVFNSGFDCFHPEQYIMIMHDYILDKNCTLIYSHSDMSLSMGDPFGWQQRKLEQAQVS